MKKTYLGLLIFLSIGIATCLTGTARAADPLINLRLSSIGPTAAGSYMEGTTTTNKTKYNMVVSDHGQVRRIELGAYYSSRATRTIELLDANRGDGGICVSRGVTGASFSDTYVTVTFDGGGTPVRYQIQGNKMCNRTAANNTNPTSSNNGLFGSYRVPDTAFDNQVDPETGKYKMQVTVAYTSIVNPSSIGRYGQGFNFRVRANGGVVGTVRTETNPTNTGISGKKSGPGGRLTLATPFGLACNYPDDTKENAAVTIYDVDNGTGRGRQSSVPLVFFVAELDDSNNIKPLSRSAYQQSGSRVRITDSGLSSPTSQVTTTWRGQSVTAFEPGDNNNEGGSTKIYIASMKKNVNYVLIVQHLSTNGASGSNNFIYYGLPGDSIFGAPDFICPGSTPVVEPRIEWNNDSYAPGDTNAVATATITNGPLEATVSGANIKLWYSDSVSDQDYTPGVDEELQVSSSAWPGGSGRCAASEMPPRSTTRNPGSIDGRYGYVCARIDVTPTAPTTSAPPFDADCREIASKPYFKVYGGDVQAGAGPSGLAAGACTDNTAKISSWNLGDGDAFAGAGTTFGSQAASIITGFASGQGGANSGRGLSFANIDDSSDDSLTTGDNYGGNFGAVASCLNVPDADVSSPPSGIQVVTTGQHQQYRVEGNYYIRNNVTYSYGSLSSISDIPSYKLIVTGNIYIDPSVTRLDGLYIAGGTIYTCAPSGTPVTLTVIAGSCTNSLDVNGSFVARKVVLARANGDVRRAVTDSSAATNSAAETFVYSPEQWLGQRGAARKPDAIISLPPSL